MKQRILLLLAGVGLLFLLAGCGNGEAMNTKLYDLTVPEEVSACWNVGFGQVVLPVPENTDEPLYIAGYNNGYEITDVLDEQRATAVWIDCGGEAVLLIGIDCVGLSNTYIEDIRVDLAAECAEWGCAVVHIYSTHTHAGIDTLGLWGPVAVEGKNKDFQQTLVEGAFEAAKLAYEDRRPGTLVYGKADTEDTQHDSRLPNVYDPYIHQLRFTPSDGSEGVRMISYAAHAEALRGANTKLSRDYPGAMADVIKEKTGDDTLFMPAAVGGLLMTRDFTSEMGFATYDENMYYTGERLANYVLNLPASEEVPVEPVMTAARTKFTAPLDNTLFMYMRFLGILRTNAIPGDGETGYALETELSVVTLGGLTLALIPGEIFPELVYGGYLPEDNAASPENENPEPLADIAKRYGYENLLICGLANDEIGYIVPPNDFLLSDTAPYFDKTMDHKGENHYEETNSLGIRTAGRIAEAFEETLKALVGE